VERGSKKYEEYARLLDELPHGRPGASRPIYHAGGIIQIIGETYFTLLEAEPRKGASFSPGERIYVGKEGRTKVSHILGRITYEELTSAARAELPSVVGTIIKSKEGRFIEFFNVSQPVTPRMHALELIPGIGKRLMWQIIDQRERRTFISFEDLQGRVNLIDPVKLLVRRVLKELSEDEKYLLFTRRM